MQSGSLSSAYLSLTPSSPRSDITATLNAVINAPIDRISAQDKEALVEAIIDDLRDSKGRIGSKDIVQGLVALKTLGRNPTSSQVIIRPKNLQVLFKLGCDAREQNSEVALEALRCIANALLLLEAGRDTLLDMHGGEAFVELLERSTASQNIFLASRILFLLTISWSQFILKVVEELRIVDIIGQKSDILLSSLLIGEPMAKEAMTDLLKFTFNILAKYPRMAKPVSEGKDKDTSESDKNAEDVWNDKLDHLLPPLLRLFNRLPPTFPSPLSPPLTHVIHSLIMIPVSPLAPVWFSPATSPVHSPTATPKLPTSEKLHKAFSALTPGRRSLSSSRSPSPARSPAQTPQDTVRRAWDLFDIATAHYVPKDPDDQAVRQLCKKEGVDFDEVITPLVVLLARFAIGDEAARHRMKDWILPVDLDRTSPLEGRSDLLGRCLRLMSCVYSPRTKDAVGEFMFALCDSDASILAGQVGYGNCAGFLFNKGIMAPPAGVTDMEGETVNPITGIRNQQPEGEVEMTEEEKEREAERLFVLFDRLERRGMVVNPIRKAMEEGKLENIS